MSGDETRRQERRLAQLEAAVARLSTRAGNEPIRLASPGGGGGFGIDMVEHLPEIPTDKVRFVHWLKPYGDDALWYAAPGYIYWSPGNRYTSKTGEPGS